MKVHCVYMPDAIMFICRMLVLLNKLLDSALFLYAGFHSVYMPDVTGSQQKNRASALCLYAGCHSVYMPNHFHFKNTMRIHCVYMPNAILAM